MSFWILGGSAGSSLTFLAGAYFATVLVSGVKETAACVAVLLLFFLTGTTVAGAGGRAVRAALPLVDLGAGAGGAFTALTAFAGTDLAALVGFAGTDLATVLVYLAGFAGGGEGDAAFLPLVTFLSSILAAFFETAGLTGAALEEVLEADLVDLLGGAISLVFIKFVYLYLFF